HELDKEHYVATCLACDQTFQPEKTGIMEKHIINCSKVDHSIRETIIYMAETREISSLNAINPKSLIKAFVCCSLPWHLIEHPFIIELLKQLRLNYNPPDRKTIINTLLTQEILRVS
ncbi:16164_t:CDS:2, partial [Funneliformis geosporum]